MFSKKYENLVQIEAQVDDDYGISWLEAMPSYGHNVLKSLQIKETGSKKKSLITYHIHSVKGENFPLKNKKIKKIEVIVT